MIKALNKLDIEGMNFNTIKFIDDKSTMKIVLNGEEMKPFYIISEMRQGCTLSHSYLSSTQMLSQSNKARVAHAYKPSSLGGRDQEDCGLKAALANSSQEPTYLEKPFTKKGWCSGSRCRP
jgi:hypothetical protein